jgi:uncharacterized protein YndB with AHSA1/START domain
MIPDIQRNLVLRASRSRVWQALTTPSEFGRWFGCTIEGTFEAGARVKMTSTVADCAGEEFCLFIERIEPERHFSWRWHPGMKRKEVDYSNEPTTLVEFTLEEVEGGTRLTVTESGFTPISLARRSVVHEENTKGWEYQMASLSRYVHGA